MSKTVADLSRKVMELLALQDPNEDVSTEDHALISNAYQSRFEELFFREIVWWPVDVIDDKAFTAIARVVAAEVAFSFGRPIPMEYAENGQPVDMGNKGLMDLKRLVSKEKSGLPTTAVYF